MRVRVLRFQSGNPVVATVLALVLLLLVLAVLVAGATLLAGVAVVGGVLGGAALLGRRVLGRGRRAAPPRLPTLDPANEVFSTRPAGDLADEPRRLPPTQ